MAIAVATVVLPVAAAIQAGAITAGKLVTLTPIRNGGYLHSQHGTVPGGKGSAIPAGGGHGVGLQPGISWI
jgi:hypothetical protein